MRTVRNLIWGMCVAGSFMWSMLGINSNSEMGITSHPLRRCGRRCVGTSVCIYTHIFTEVEDGEANVHSFLVKTPHLENLNEFLKRNVHISKISPHD